MRNGFNVVLLAAGLAGCAEFPQESRSEKADTFGQSFTAEWRSQGGHPVSSAPAAASASAAPLAGTEAERKEFEDWRAWQEWKRNNPK